MSHNYAHTHTHTHTVAWSMPSGGGCTVEHNKQMKLIMDTNISIICQAAQDDKTKVENEGHRIKSQIEVKLVYARVVVI